MCIGESSDDVRVTSVSDGECAHAEVFTAGSSQFNVVAVVMMNSALSQHSLILDKTLSVGFKIFAISIKFHESILEPLKSFLRESMLDHSIAFSKKEAYFSVIKNDSIWLPKAMEVRKCYFSVIKSS